MGTKALGRLCEEERKIPQLRDPEGVGTARREADAIK
jgi:hypothetical protein